MDILNDEESFNEETPLINEKILQHIYIICGKRVLKSFQHVINLYY